jgi:hypothetical protein
MESRSKTLEKGSTSSSILKQYCTANQQQPNSMRTVGNWYLFHFKAVQPSVITGQWSRASADLEDSNAAACSLKVLSYVRPMELEML